MVVAVASERGGEWDLEAAAAIEAPADIVELGHLDHEVHDAARDRALEEGEAVMAGVAAAATGASISGGVAGAAGGVSKAGRQNAMGATNEGFEHLIAPNSKAKASGVETVKAGAAQGAAAGTKESGKAIGTAVGESATNATAETVGTAATTAAMATAGTVAAVGGAINTGFAAKGLHDAYTFNPKSLYHGTSEEWANIATNLQNFRLSLAEERNTMLEPTFCGIVRRKLLVTEAKVNALRQSSS